MMRVIEARLDDGDVLRAGVYPTAPNRLWFEVHRKYEDEDGDHLVPERVGNMTIHEFRSMFEQLNALQGEMDAAHVMQQREEQEQAAREQAQLAPVLRLAVPDEPSWEDTDDQESP